MQRSRTGLTIVCLLQPIQREYKKSVSEKLVNLCLSNQITMQPRRRKTTIKNNFIHGGWKKKIKKKKREEKAFSCSPRINIDDMQKGAQ